MSNDLDRTPIELAALAAWLNVPVDKIPPENRAHTCEHTMAAWKRVVYAIRDEPIELESLPVNLYCPEDIVTEYDLLAARQIVARWRIGYSDAILKGGAWKEMVDAVAMGYAHGRRNA